MTDTLRKGRVPVVSAAIDPLLFEGGRRINQMAELVVEQLRVTKPDVSYTKAQVVNNIRARINALRKRGYVIERETVERRRIKLVRVAVEVSPATVQ